jgi:hypothetical protein
MTGKASLQIATNKAQVQEDESETEIKEVKKPPPPPVKLP